MHKTTVYRMLHRHGWRKHPRRRHRKPVPEVLEDFKKGASQDGSAIRELVGRKRVYDRSSEPRRSGSRPIFLARSARGTVRSLYPALGQCANDFLVPGRRGTKANRRAYPDVNGSGWMALSRPTVSSRKYRTRFLAALLSRA
ncbi:MAG: winged helix-turn-helix domain-containing protein [Candidatus Accumulibacter sp.]|nr:winged helix-turn-helix domain-containing protein [Accumulibacter sp.]